MAKKHEVKTKEQPAPKNQRILQTDLPGRSLEQALRVPGAIIENYGSDPVTPLDVASALDMTPTSGPFRQLCGTSVAYGLTEGGYNADKIQILPLAKRILKPEEEGDDLAAKKEALLKPRIMKEFLEKYNGNALPRRSDIALNVLVGMGVPQARAESAYALILDSANSVGLIREIKGKQYVHLADTTSTLINRSDADESLDGQEGIDIGKNKTDSFGNSDPQLPRHLSQQSHEQNRHVFIAHGKNKDFVEPIKKLLPFGEMIALVSIDKQSVSKPVPEKVMDDMRSCSAAIIHVVDEQRLMDQEAKEHVVINPNVLIEIGAAMALFGRRFILLVKDGVTLPSNLHGLYEVRYEGDALDGNATIRLLEAINDIKNNPLPARYTTPTLSES